MELLKYAEETANIKLHVDMYGGGPDKDAAEAKAEKMGVDMSFLGPVDHAKLASTHKVKAKAMVANIFCSLHLSKEVCFVSDRFSSTQAPVVSTSDRP